MSFLNRIVDERFLDHRRRSTSVAGVVGALLATGLFGYRYYFDHVWSWDLLAVSLTVVVVKVALMTWYLFTD
jgi:hypothetical protein